MAVWLLQAVGWAVAQAVLVRRCRRAVMLHRSNRLCQRALTALRPAVRAICVDARRSSRGLVASSSIKQTLAADDTAPVQCFSSPWRDQRLRCGSRPRALERHRRDRKTPQAPAPGTHCWNESHRANPATLSQNCCRGKRQPSPQCQHKQHCAALRERFQTPSAASKDAGGLQQVRRHRR